MGFDDGGGRTAADIEDGGQGSADRGEVILGDTEGSSGHCDLSNEVSDLSSGKIHEPGLVSASGMVGTMQTYL